MSLNLTQPFQAFHSINPAEKDNFWAAKAFNEIYNHGGAETLLASKRPDIIRSYAEGRQDVQKYQKMFRRMQKEIQKSARSQMDGLSDLGINDITGIDWEPLALLATPLNAALSNTKKQPIYVKCSAIDGLAQEKKKKDLDILKNRPAMDQEINAISKALGISLQSPAEMNNADGVDIANFDLDPGQEDELNFYMNMFYKLRPESAFENLLRALAHVKKLKQIKDLEARDQLYYGVSCNRAFFSDITGLPDVQYLYPGDVWTTNSDLPDRSDVPYIFIKKLYSAEEILNEFGNEMDPTEVVKLFDAYFDSRGYESNYFSGLDDRARERQRIPICYFEMKSWDTIKRHRFKHPTNGHWLIEQVAFDYELRHSPRHPEKALRGQPKEATPEDFLDKKYVQNTYTGYWIPSYPEKVFKFKKLEGSYRKSGEESMSPFSINIEKTQAKGAVEQCIPVIDDAQRAYFKLQHCIIKSKPKGAYYDFKYIRQAAANLSTSDFSMSVGQLVDLLVDNNTMIGDSEDMDPAAFTGGARPFYEMPGGVGNEVQGYLLVIEDAIKKIAMITGINDQLTGTGTSPEGLIGLQKLLLQSSLNTIFYVQDAMKSQTEKVFRMWANLVQHIVKNKNSAAYDAIVMIIGQYKVKVLEDMDTIASHRFGIIVENAPSEEEQNMLNQMMFEMTRSERISSSDFFTLKRIYNYKDATQLLSIREKKNRERQQEQAQAQNDAMLQAKQMETEAKLNVARTSSENEIREEQVKSDTAKWIEQFRASTGLNIINQTNRAKEILQDKRGVDQLNKEREKVNLKAQEAL